MQTDDNYILKLEKALRQIRKYQKGMLSSQEIELTIDQWILIKEINESKELSQIQLAKLTGKDPASIKRMLDILEKEDYILKKKIRKKSTHPLLVAY